MGISEDSGITFQTAGIEGLKPCPFCGGEALMHTELWKGKPFAYYVMCMDCSAAHPYSETKEEAVTLWNRRNSEKKGIWLENTDGTHFCSNCQKNAHSLRIGSFFREWLDNYCHNCGSEMEVGVEDE